MKYGCLLSTKTQKFHISASLGQILVTLVSILVVSGAISRLVINGSDQRADINDGFSRIVSADCVSRRIGRKKLVKTMFSFDRNT